MKTLSITAKILSLSLIVFGTGILLLCAKPEKKENKHLFTSDSLTSMDTDYFKERGFLEADEKIVYVYYLSTISSDAVLLTNKKIVVYNEDSVEKELLENIFDLSISHATDPEEKSKITIYRKDDTEFSYAFPGGLDIDEKFFSELRILWRKIISEKQNSSEASDTSEAKSIFLGVKSEEENERTIDQKK